MKKVAIYVRVSTQEQAVEGYSISEQIDRLTKFCEAHSWKIYKVYTDPGFSGGNMNRPSLQKLFADCTQKRFDTVLVYKLDRLSRSQKDTLYIIEDLFLTNHVDFISMSENFDTSTPFGRAMIGILSVFAQLEREQIKERMAMGREGRAKQGKWHGGGNVPIGYDFINDYLIPNEYEAAQVKQIFDLAIRGYSYSDIARSMSGYTTKYGPYKVGYNTISLILQNPIYIGKIKTNTGYINGIHEPLIDETTFNEVQKKVTQIAEYYKKEHTGHYGQYLLSELCRCASCGATYSAHYVGTKKHRYKYYKCRNRAYNWRDGSPKCMSPNIRVEVLDNAVLNEIRHLQLDPDYFDEVSNSPAADSSSLVETLNKRLENIQKQIARTIRLYSLGSVEEKDIENQLQILYSERDTLSLEIENATADQKDTADVKSILSMSNIDELDDTEKHNLVCLLINHIMINSNGDFEIHWTF